MFFARGWADGHTDAHGCALSIVRPDLYVAAVGRDDSVADGEPKARARPGGLRRVERVEDMRAMFGRDACAAVADLDDDLAGERVVACGDQQLAAFWHSVARVEQQVEKDLLELVSVGEDERRILVLFRAQAKTLESLVEAGEANAGRDDAVDVERRARRRARSREIHHVAQDLRDAVNLCRDKTQHLLRLGVHLRARL